MRTLLKSVLEVSSSQGLSAPGSAEPVADVEAACLLML